MISAQQILAIMIPAWLYIYIYVYILGLLLRHMEAPRLGVELELQLPDYATATQPQQGQI